MKFKTFSLLLAVATLALCSCKPKMPTSEGGYRSINVAAAQQMIASNDELVIIDVRTPDEIAEGFIPNALKIDVMDDNFATEIAKLDKSKTCLVYCRSGGRSVKASKIMLENGFTDVVNMEGGYSAWPK